MEFFHVKLNRNNSISLNKNKIIEILRISIGNNIINLSYKKKQINFKKKYNIKNIGKMRYEANINDKEIKILNQIFISNNMRRAKIIINNKQFNLKENINNKNQFYKIKIKFLDYAIELNSIFEDCKSLSSVNNFQNLNTRYIKTIYNLFSKCNSLLYIDDISNWNISKINDISGLFFQCSSLKYLPDISNWNTSNVNNMHCLFSKCSSLVSLSDISKWDLSKVNNISKMFYECSSLIQLPDISKWNTKQVTDMNNLFSKCSKLKFYLIFQIGKLIKLKIFLMCFLNALI